MSAVDEKPPNTPANGSGSAMCPLGHPWYATFSTDDAGVLTVAPETCPDVGAGHEEGCGLPWVARMTWGEGEPPGDWVQREATEHAAAMEQAARMRAAGALPVPDVAAALDASRAGAQ